MSCGVVKYTITCFFIKACSCLEILIPCPSKVSQVLSSKNRFKHLHPLGGCFSLYVKIHILNGRHTGDLVKCNFLLMAGSGKPQSSGSVSLRHKNGNNQTSESQEFNESSCYHTGMDNKLAKMEEYQSFKAGSRKRLLSRDE